MKYIKGFDGLRAISIVFVLLTHLGIYTTLKEFPFLEKNYNLFSGTSGVMIFFTISGFLITLLLIHEKKAQGFINIKYFFIRRFLKLAPPLILFLATVFILMILNILPSDYLALLFSFFYLYNFVPLSHYTGELGHTWSLGVEEQFYFVWPFIINKIKKLKTGLLIAFTVIIICLIISSIYALPSEMIERLNFFNKNFYLERWFIPACLPIMLGSFTSIVLMEHQNYLSSKIHKNYPFLALALFLFTAQIYIPILPTTGIILFQAIGVSCFLLWIYLNQNSRLLNLLELKPIVFIGKISYSLYVFQGLFLRTGPSGTLLIQEYPFNIILTFLFATLSYFFIEKRFQVLKNKYRV